jgi:hypothetical protein
MYVDSQDHFTPIQKTYFDLRDQKLLVVVVWFKNVISNDKSFPQKQASCIFYFPTLFSFCAKWISLQSQSPFLPIG